MVTHDQSSWQSDPTIFLLGVTLSVIPHESVLSPSSVPSPDAQSAGPPSSHNPNFWAIGEVFFAFLMQGLTAFGGPIAHLAYFRTTFVEHRKWLSDAHYAELVAFCQFLPGPASSQTGIAIGLLRAGMGGAFAAWLGFTLPSALLMAFVASLTPWLIAEGGSDGLLGLKAVAVAVVVQAVWGMAKTLCPDRSRQTLALLLAALTWFIPGVLGQFAVLGIGAVFGLGFLKPIPKVSQIIPISLPVWFSLLNLGVFFGLLVGLPLLNQILQSPLLYQFESFFKAGSLVFGGGHVVLPLLQTSFVTPQGVSMETFLVGYGAAQAVPGPLFTFSSYLGMAMTGIVGAFVATIGIFLPSFLLVFGLLPFWVKLAENALMSRAMQGINAAVVGLLLGALYDPIWQYGITSNLTAAIALLAWGALALWKLPPWSVVLGSAGVGYLSTLL